MSIEISQDVCIGCGQCAKSCPGTLIQLDDKGKACISRIERCWGCASCVKECPVQAIAMFLGEDMGGLGGKLTVGRENTLLHWIITKPDGDTQILTVDSRDPNKY
ncbi:4Fe-4S dicluster domain-containing protein [Anaerocolumna xylanovorans]|uniref:Ferredoxin n=1 Tax=Anaerocolumna xylanovorans DSM 12503 TaxID=1121345 RepID=A0A1M7YMW7_9FIRM|nr:ferredoxin family protein [Anaerocolumna xylanovorans]SHO53960.1 adenylylsulfate reductase subunit B [Anaerocolumna xylanovorans DSM 12503]